MLGVALFTRKKLAALVGAVVLFSTFCHPVAVRANVLQGGVEQDDEMTRLSRPKTTQNGNAEAGLRLQRPMPAPDFRANRPITGMVDTRSFGPPLSGNAGANDVKLGLLKPTDFGTIPNSKFDLGAERGSRELTLAWEAWHHQLSEAIYRRWGRAASVAGQATLRITVTRDRHIIPSLVHSSGSEEFDEGLVMSVRSLDGNPGLTFPAESQRQQVSLEADYIAATDIRPGFSWVKNDYEHVNQSY